MGKPTDEEREKKITCSLKKLILLLDHKENVSMCVCVYNDFTNIETVSFASIAIKIDTFITWLFSIFY